MGHRKKRVEMKAESNVLLACLHIHTLPDSSLSSNSYNIDEKDRGENGVHCRKKMMKKNIG